GRGRGGGAGRAVGRLTCPVRRRLAFASADRAQGWLEWRRGWPMLFLLGIGLACSLTVACLSTWALGTRGTLEGLPEVAAAVERFGVGWLSGSQPLLARLIISLVGTDLGQLSTPRGLAPSTFYPPLPISPPAVLRA